jgi:SNF2 family DNA or RNA helicase
MATIHRKCEECGKVARVSFEIKLDFGRLTTFECGHTVIMKGIENNDAIYLKSRTGKELFPFQAETIKFMEEAGGVCLIGHEMALGKTVCAAGFIGRNKEEALPGLYLCKSSTKINVLRELIEWAGLVGQVIDSSIQRPHLDIFPITIMSIDMLARVTAKTKTINGVAGMPNPECWPDEIWTQYKTVVVDECQSIKNPDSQRSQALKKHLSHVKYRLPMSGTAIMNAAHEYFPVLNFIRPDVFSSYAGFINYETVGRRLANPTKFHEKTKNFIIRKTRAEVLPDLPKVFRTFRPIQMDDEVLIKKYQETVQEFSDWMDENEDKMSPAGYTNLLAFFAKMRQITGISKVPAAIDYVEEFLLECDRKLVIFLHHKAVATLLTNRLNQTMKDMGRGPVLSFHSGLDSTQRQMVIDDFYKPEHRIMVASTLAAGEGINLQCCSDCLMLERQWNPAKEEQAEARFPRPGQTADKINATYLTALGTIDEFLGEMVEGKRAANKSTLDNKELDWDEASLMRALADAIWKAGNKRWNYK